MKFDFKKKFGQNFLSDPNITSKIVDTLSIKENDLVIEIGPGVGALTKHIIKKNPYLLLYEIDIDTKLYLDKIINEKTSIIFDDFLNRNIIDDIKEYKYENLYVIGNLPYYITTPIILKIIESKLNISKMTFMVQNEVADRFSSKPGNKEYGSITVLLNYFYKIKKEFIVNRKYFQPIPNVDSAIISFTNNDNYYNIDYNKFNEIIKAAFHMKRKNLRNNFKNYNLEEIERVLKNYNFTLQDRAESLPLEVFVELSKII